MDKYKVKVNPRAIRELDHIYEYIANEKLAPENAKGQVDRIKKAILGLETFPQSHQERNEGRYAAKDYHPCEIRHKNIRKMRSAPNVWYIGGYYEKIYCFV